MLLLVLTLATSGGFRNLVPRTTVSSRPCPSSWSTPAPEPKIKRSKRTGETPNPGACIELSLSPLEVQEFLQSYARSKHWMIFEEHLSEDSWTFSLAMTKEDLLAATRTNPIAEKVEWRSGIALVQVISAPSTDGYTRTIVRTSFRGYGENPDQFATQREYWELASNGSFESSIVAALQNHFKSAP